MYQTEEAKPFFHYEWLDSVDKLDSPSLPLFQACYSSLNQKNTLGDTEVEVEENYQPLQRVWHGENMSSFSNFWGTFVEAMEKCIHFTSPWTLII